MNFLVHSAMIVVMLLHSICGCCWHHDHGDCCSSDSQSYGHSESNAGGSHTCGHSHDCDHSHSDASAPIDGEKPHEPHAPCDQDECVYVAAKAFSAPLTFEVAFIKSLDWPCAAGVVADIHRRVEVAEASPRRLSSLEACALLQVWRV